MYKNLAAPVSISWPTHDTKMFSFYQLPGLLYFAENYSFIVQDAVQGHHWNNSQATLHPFAVYFKKDT